MGISGLANQGSASLPPSEAVGGEGGYQIPGTQLPVINLP